MADRIPFEIDAVKAYLKAEFEDARQATRHALADADGDRGAPPVLIHGSHATALSFVYAALFGEHLLPDLPAQEGDVVQ